jgi:hypothetical protein
MRLTPDATNRLDRYLEEMRASLAGSAPADVIEVEQDIRDHVSHDLAGSPAPVSIETLDAVLDRLGSPHQWAGQAPAESPDRSDDARFTQRLAYASAGSAVVFLALPPLLVVSWMLARWTLARIDESGESLGSRRWLLYPPILIVTATVGVIALFWIVGPLAELGAAFYLNPQRLSSRGASIIGAAAVTLAGLGAYWIVLGPVLAFGERAVRMAFHPFAADFRARHGWWLMGVGAAITAAALSVVLFLGR